MRFRSIPFVSLAAAFLLPPVLPLSVLGQSFPAGQVTRRMQSAPIEADFKVPPRLADFSDIITPPATKPGHFLVMKPNAAYQFVFDADLSAHANSAVDTKPVSPQSAAVVCSSDRDADQKMQSAAIGTAAIAAWNEVLKLDKEHPSDNPTEVQTARRIACLVTDDLDLQAAHDTVDANLNQSGLTPDVIAGIKDIGSAIPFARSSKNPHGELCWVTATSTTANGQTSTTKSYVYPHWFPMYHQGCNSNSQILNFFANTNVNAGDSVQYLYNAQQSASSVSADLLTTTFFPGIQVVLGSAAVAGSGDNSSSSSSTGAAKRAATGTTTDTSSANDNVQTAIAKLENGGDFNLRVPIPFLSRTSQSKNWSMNGAFLPNFGLTLNKFGSQQTITGTNEYSGNFPAEVYAQIGSVGDPTGNSVAAVGFVDLRAAGEWISSALATKLGSTGSGLFPILQASAGIEFSEKIRFSVQYIYSSSQFCQVSGSTTCSTSTSTTSTGTSATKINGLHFTVSFSPQKAKNQDSSK